MRSNVAIDCHFGNNPIADIIVPVYNSPEWVRRCIYSVLKNSDLPFQIIIVDDGSDGYTKNLLKSFKNNHNNIKLYLNKTNIGFVKSCNKGISLSSAPYIILLNTDAIVPPFWLSRMIQCADSDMRIGIINPLSNEAANISIPIAPGCNFLGQDENLRLKSPTYPDIVTAVGFCILLRREMLIEIGIFDEIYGHGYCEETDLCIRAMKAGWRVVACDNIYVYHRGSVSFHDRNERFHKNLRIFLNRYGKFYKKAYVEFNKKSPLEKINSSVTEPRTSRLRQWFHTGHTIANDLINLHPLKAIRHFREGKDTITIHKNPSKYNNFWRKNRPSVTFLFDSLGRYGGVMSLLLIANGLIARGFEVRIASLVSGEGYIKGLYTQPLFFGSFPNLLKNIPYSDIFVSTVWITAYWLSHLRKRFPNAQYISYLQDYESFFLPEWADDRKKVIVSYNLPNYLITTSKWLHKKLQAHGKTSFIIQKGIDGDIFRIKENIKRIPLSVLAMARPHTPYRGFETIKSIFRQLNNLNSNIRLGLFGSFEKEIDDLDFSVKNHGIIENGSALAELYNKYTVFIDPSDFQGFGMIGLEAMACGCACVMTNIGGIVEYAQHGINCILISPNNVEAFVKKIHKLLIDNLLKKSLIKNALITSKKFSLETEIEKFSEYFTAILEK
jgi:GT2 family glycosyltransferase